MIISVFAHKLRMNRSVQPADGLFRDLLGIVVVVVVDVSRTAND
jgi:hypothetical protein